MSARVLSLNPDLKRLRDEGYEIEFKEGHAIVHHVPYVNANQQIQMGILISPLNMNGDLVRYNQDHVIYFQGTFPCYAMGDPISGISHGNYKGRMMAGMRVDFSFSNKPQTGYRDYYEKFTRYIAILQAEAQALDSGVTATTFKHIVSDDSSIFVYADTNASRATITDISDKLRNQKIGIIGVGGTGAYILDQVAKTPVTEIHLYDGDIFCQHNAFRAPGAPNKEILENIPKKTDYFAEVYNHMHRGVHSHPVFITDNNIDELRDLNFVFLCMDTGECKRIIIQYLIECNIAFIDTGIDISECNRELMGMTRITSGCFNGQITDEEKTAIQENISYAPVIDADLYRSNIQTADLNAFCALMAVLKWKKHCGFYQDLSPYQNRIYNTNDGEFK